MQNPKFVINKNSNGQFYFRLVGSSGETILIGEEYPTLGAAEGGVLSVRSNAVQEERYELRQSRKEEPYFVLKGASGEVIGTSRTYRTGQAMKSGMEAVQRSAVGAGVEEWG